MAKDKIPEQIVAQLLESMVHIEDQATDAEKNRQLKSRLLNKIREQKHSHINIIRAGSEDFVPFFPGVDVCVLQQSDGMQSYFLKIAQDAVVPPHHHPLHEECVVLSGSICIGDMTFGPGTYHLAPSVFDHDVIRSTTGALLFLRGAVPNAGQLDWTSKQLYTEVIPKTIKTVIGC